MQPHHRGASDILLPETPRNFFRPLQSDESHNNTAQMRFALFMAFH